MTSNDPRGPDDSFRLTAGFTLGLTEFEQPTDATQAYGSVVIEPVYTNDAVAQLWLAAHAVPDAERRHAAPEDTATVLLTVEDIGALIKHLSACARALIANRDQKTVR